MKLQIKKYKLGRCGDYTVEMPYGSIVLSVKNCNDDPALFVVSDQNSTICSRRFFVFNTEQEIATKDINHLKFIGTVQDEWSLVEWHVFEYTY